MKKKRDPKGRLVLTVSAEGIIVRTHSKPFDDDSRQEPKNPTVRNPDQENGILQMFDVLDAKASQLRNEERCGYYGEAPNTPYPSLFSKVRCETCPIKS
jgi:hypothetical protein